MAVALLVLSRLLSPEAAPPLPELTVIPLPSATATATPAPTSTPMPTAIETPVDELGGPRDFAAGQLVLISGTGGEGLRLREAPGLESAVRLVALESEVFEVVDGPVPSDGFNWWLLINPYDRGKEGWAADLYLQRLES